MSDPIVPPSTPAPGPPKRPEIQIGRHGSQVVLALEGRPMAMFTAPEAALLAALLVKHACAIASGATIVKQAIDEAYGAIEPTPIIHIPVSGNGSLPPGRG